MYVVRGVIWTNVGGNAVGCNEIKWRRYPVMRAHLCGHPHPQVFSWNFLQKRVHFWCIECAVYWVSIWHVQLWEHLRWWKDVVTTIGGNWRLGLIVVTAWGCDEKNETVARCAVVFFFLHIVRQELHLLSLFVVVHKCVSSDCWSGVRKVFSGASTQMRSIIVTIFGNRSFSVQPVCSLIILRDFQEFGELQGCYCTFDEWYSLFLAIPYAADIVMATGANMSFTIVVTQMTIFGVVHVHDVITIMVLKRWRLDAYVDKPIIMLILKLDLMTTMAIMMMMTLMTTTMMMTMMTMMMTMMTNKKPAGIAILKGRSRQDT